jgi:type III secretion system low calcium response chaperone LcrH/SycD
MKKHQKEDVHVNTYLIDPLVRAAVKERPHNSLESDKHFTDRLKKQLNRSLHDLQKRVKAGIALLEKHKKWPHDERLKKAAELLVDPSGSEERISHAECLQKIIGITDLEMTDFYTEGWDSHQRGAYQEAGNIFLLLTQLNPKVGSFWSALGAAEEKVGDTEGAAQAYIFGAEFELGTLAPYLHGAKCLLQLNKTSEARKVLERAIERAKEEPKLKEHLPIAEQMLRSIK